MNTTLILASEAARILDVAAETVRYFERTGRLSAQRTSNGVRLFNRDEVARMAAERTAAKASR